MKNIKVELVHLPPQIVIVNGVEKPYLFEKATMETAAKVVKVLKHDSVAEHTQINFNISGISRLSLLELSRHRMTEFDIDSVFSSITAQSTRYTLDKVLKLDLDTIEIDDYFVIPPYDDKKFENMKSYDMFVTELRCAYIAMLEVMQQEFKHTSIDYLKYFLPEGLRVELAWSINIRSLRNFLMLRDAPSAHFEIRYLAQLIRNLLKDTYVSKLID